MKLSLNSLKKEKNNKTPSNQLSLKERLSALRNLPRFFKLVWETNRWMTIVNSVLRIIKSATPLAILYVGKLIIDQVILSHAKIGVSSHHLWMLVATEFGLAILSDSLSRAITLMDSLLGD